MGRAALGIFLAMVLAGCSATTGGVHHDPDHSGDMQTLKGVTSEYSIRLSELPKYDELDDDSSMLDGLVAGDKAVHIAVSAFEVKSYLALDLIVNNRQNLPLEIERADVRLVDSKGQWMVPVEDFPGADQYGLRGKSYRPDPNVPYDGLGLYDPDTAPDALGYGSSSARGKGSTQLPEGAVSSKVRGNGPIYTSWSDQAPVVTVEGRHMIYIFEK